MAKKDDDYFDNTSMVLLRFPHFENEDVIDALLDITDCEVEVVGYFRFDGERLVRIH